MTDDEDRFESLRRLSRRAKYDQANRLGLLVVHCFIGWAITLFFGSEVPITWTAIIGEDGVLPVVATAAPGVGGSLLLMGLLSHRNLTLEAAGMSLMLAWDIVGMVAVVAYLATPGVNAPLQYQLALYGGLAALMVVHLVTLIVFRIESRRGRV